MPTTPEESLELKLPAQQFSALASAVLTDVLERGGVAEAIKQAALAALACRGLLDKRSAAAFLRIEERTLENWMKPETEGGKGLPHFKFGRDVRFRLDALEAWAGKFEINPVVRKLAA